MRIDRMESLPGDPLKNGFQRGDTAHHTVTTPGKMVQKSIQVIPPKTDTTKLVAIARSCKVERQDYGDYEECHSSQDIAQYINERGIA